MDLPRVEILTIGDEILYGQITDTNSQFISTEVDRAGFKVIRKSSVGDEEHSILQAFREAHERADITLITGGLGPTSDDRTKPCLAKFFDCDIAINEQALKELTELLRSRGRELSERNRQQAALPTKATMVSNKMGTAPGMWFEENGKVFVSMPGVPHEMREMVRTSVVPMLADRFKPAQTTMHHFIKLSGIAEASLAELIRPWEEKLPSKISLAYLPSPGEIRLRLTASGLDPHALQKEFDALTAGLQRLAGKYFYGTGDDSLESAVGRMLRERKLTLSAAESCTGGYFSHLITSVPGSSDYFKGSIIAYANEVKEAKLGVHASTLRQYGAVSEQTIREMANGVRQNLNTDIGVATSGIAGPDGGTAEKPVGLIWLALADAGKTVTRELRLGKDRDVNIRLSSRSLLHLIRTTFDNSE